MISNFRFIDHTADIAIEVSGNTYTELFLAALEGWKNAVMEFSENKREAGERDIKLIEDSPEELLVSFLQEINYLFDIKKIIPVEVKKIQIEKTNEGFQSDAKILFGNILTGDNIKNEIKAVTFHQLDIKKSNGIYKTIIVFDI